jgi:CheY-like chemotaxis protein
MERKFVLWAEDEEVDELILRRAIARAGVPLGLVRVPDGLEAVNYLQGKAPYADRSRYPAPGLLLLDLKMPRMGGLELLAWLSENLPRRDLPVVVFSSSSADQRDALALGADEYQVKPNNPEELIPFVKELYERCLPGGHD